MVITLSVEGAITLFSVCIVSPFLHRWCFFIGYIVLWRYMVLLPFFGFDHFVTADGDKDKKMVCAHWHYYGGIDKGPI